METNVNAFMNQNGVKPGFLEESKDTNLINFEISMESTDNETNEATQSCQVKNMEAIHLKEVCDESQIGLEKIGNETSPNEVKKRWGKKEDKILWKTIRRDISHGVYTLEILKNIPLAEAKDNINIIQLSDSIGWKTTNAKLLERIQKSISDNFSAREEILLRKLIKKKSYKNLDYEAILSHFPGKSRVRIMEVCQNFCKAKKMKKLTAAKII